MIYTHLARLIHAACDQGNYAVADILLSAASEIANRTPEEEQSLAELRKKVYALDSGKGFFSSSMSLSGLPRMSDFQEEMIQPRDAVFDEDPHVMMKDTIDPWIEKMDPNGDVVEFGGHFHAIMKFLVDRIMSHGQLSMHIEENFGGTVHTGWRQVYSGWINEDLRIESYQRLNQVMEKFIAFNTRIEREHLADPKVRNSYIQALLFQESGYSEFPMMCAYVAKDEAWGIDNLKSETKASINSMLDERLSDTDETLVTDYSAQITQRAKEIIATGHPYDKYFLMRKEESPRALELAQEKELLDTKATGSAAELVRSLHTIYPVLIAGAAEAVTLGMHPEDYADALLLRAQADALLQKLSADFRTPIQIDEKGSEPTVSDAYTAVQMALATYGKMSKEIGGILAIRALRSAHLIDVYRTLQMIDTLNKQEASDLEQLMGLPNATLDGRLTFDQDKELVHERLMDVFAQGTEQLPDPVDVLAGSDISVLPADVSELELKTLLKFLKSIQGQIVFDERMKNHALVRDVAADRMAVGMQCDTFTHMIAETALRILLESDSPLQMKRSNILPLHVLQARDSDVSGFDNNHGSVLMVLPSGIGDGYRYAFIDPNLVYGVKKGPYIVLLKQEDLTMTELRSTAAYPEIGTTAKKITLHPKNLAVFGEDGKVHETPYSSDLFIQLPKEVAVYFDREWSGVSDQSIVDDLFAVDAASAYHIAPADVGINFALLRDFSRLIYDTGDGMAADEKLARQVLETVMYDHHRRFLNPAAYLTEGVYKPERHLDELIGALPLALYLNHRYASLFLLKHIKEVRSKNKEVDAYAAMPEKISDLIDNDMAVFYDGWAQELNEKGAGNSIGIEFVKNEIGKTWKHLFPDEDERGKIIQSLSAAVERLVREPGSNKVTADQIVEAGKYYRALSRDVAQSGNSRDDLAMALNARIQGTAATIAQREFKTDHPEAIKFDGLSPFAPLEIPAIVELKDAQVTATMLQILREHPQILASVAPHLLHISQLLRISPWNMRKIAQQLGPSLTGKLGSLELPSST